MFHDKSSIIIAICGNKRSGKDTLANILINREINTFSIYKRSNRCISILPNDPISFIGEKAVRFSFADEAKKDFCEKFNINPVVWIDNDVKTKEFYRTQLIGYTKPLLDANPDLYTKELKSIYENDDARTIVITDLRRSEELEYIKRHGWPIVTIRTICLSAEYVEESEFEHALDDYETDYVAIRT